MSKTKLKVGVNKFNVLMSSDEDEAFEEEEEEVKVRGPVIDPKSKMGVFHKYARGSETAQGLADALEKLLSDKKNTRTYDYKFDSYDGISIPQYKDILEIRVNCFSDRVDSQTLDHAYDLWKSLKDEKNKDLAPVLQTTIKKLSAKKPTGHGGLLFIGGILCRQPELMTTKLLDVAYTDDPIAMHVMGWLIAYTGFYSKQPLPAKNLLTYFYRILFDPDAKYGALAVCVAHCIKMSFDKDQKFLLSEKNYCLVQKLTRYEINNRGKHIASLLKEYADKVKISDPYHYAAAMMNCYNDMENFLMDELVKNTENATVLANGKVWCDEFIEGWKKYNVDNEYGKKMLTRVTDRLSFDVIQKFPQNDLSGESDKVLLSKKQKELAWRSVRSIIFGSIAAAVAYAHYSLELF